MSTETTQRARDIVAAVWTKSFASLEEDAAKERLAFLLQTALDAERAEGLRWAAGMVGAAFGGMGELRDAIEAEADKLEGK